MRKMFVAVFAVVLTMTLTITAFAKGSPIDNANVSDDSGYAIEKVTIDDNNEVDELQKLWDNMKSNKIDVSITQGGVFIEKYQHFYGREIIGIDEKNGTFILSPWRMLGWDRDVIAGDDKSFSIPGDYVAFGFSVDISLGTDWPYSGVFWNDPNTPVDKVYIYVDGFVRSVDVKINVNRETVFEDTNCSSHKQWNPDQDPTWNHRYY